METARTFSFSIADGRHVDLDVSPILLERLRASYDLESVDEVTTYHLKCYLASSMRAALEAEDGRQPV